MALFTSSAALPRWLAPLALLVGGALLAALWVVLGIFLESQAGWMAWLAALDAVFLLRIGGMRSGPARAITALLATVAIAVLANWFIIASQLGFNFGLYPWESAVLLRPGHAWTLAQLANTGLDCASLVLAPLLAAWLAK